MFSRKEFDLREFVSPPTSLYNIGVGSRREGDTAERRKCCIDSCGHQCYRGGGGGGGGSNKRNMMIFSCSRPHTSSVIDATFPPSTVCLHAMYTCMHASHACMHDCVHPMHAMNAMRAMHAMHALETMQCMSRCAYHSMGNFSATANMASV